MEFMAYILDQHEPVIVMTGHVVVTEAADGTVTTKLQFSEDVVVDIPPEISDFFVFMKIPRLQSEAHRWFSENGEDKSELKKLIRSGWFLFIPPMPYRKYLATFEGIRVVPTCYLQKEAQNFDDFHYATIPEHDVKKLMVRVTPLLGASMWESLEGEDLPTSVNRFALPNSFKLAPPTPYSKEQKAAMTLMNLDELLQHGYVHLERVDKPLEPKAEQTSWFSKLLARITGS
jgi:hypothetical protein